MIAIRDKANVKIPQIKAIRPITPVINTSNNPVRKVTMDSVKPIKKKIKYNQPGWVVAKLHNNTFYLFCPTKDKPAFLLDLPPVLSRGYWGRTHLDNDGYVMEGWKDSSVSIATFIIGQPRSYEIASLMQLVSKNKLNIIIDDPSDDKKQEKELLRIFNEYLVYTGIRYFPEKDIFQSHKYPLREHQLKEVQKQILTSGACNFSQTGTGKTVMTIGAIFNKWLQEGKPMEPVLIVCPNSLRLTWKKEFEIFTKNPDGTNNVKPVIIMGNGPSRKWQLIQAATELPDKDNPKMKVLICGYDTMADDIENFKALPYFAVVADEAHRIKNPAANRTKSLFELQEKTRYRYSLTGTPQANKFSDVYPLIEWVYPNYWNTRVQELNKEGRMAWSNLATGHTKFEGMYGETGWGSRGISVKQSKAIELSDAVDYISCRYLLTDMVDQLPEQLIEPVFFDLSEKQKIAYRKLQEDLKLKAEQLEMGGNKSLAVSCILTQYLRLEQITSGYVVWDIEGEFDYETNEFKEEFEIAEYFAENPKLEALKPIVSETIEDNKMIIWCHFQRDIELVSEYLAKSKINHRVIYGKTSERNRQEYMEAFNTDPSMRVLVANAGCLGEGVTLLGCLNRDDSDEKEEVPATVHVFYSMNWSFTNFQQAKARTYRIGIKHTNFVYVLQARNSIDEYIYDVVLNKKKQSDIIIDKMWTLIE